MHLLIYANLDDTITIHFHDPLWVKNSTAMYHAPMTKQENNTGPSLKFMLIALAVISPFAFQVFLPSMPGLVDDFGASPAAVQLTASVYVSAFAFPQLGYGPLSDRFGRRRVILTGLAVYVTAPLICATAESIEVLVAGRALQAIGGCAGLMFARVIARDLYERNRAVVDPVTGQVTTREATLTDLSMRGFFGHAEVSLGPLLQAEASYQYLDTEGSGDHRIQGRASLKQALLRHLRKVSKAEAYYENHRRGASHHGLFDATSETRFGYRLVVEPLPRLSILWEVQFTYEPDEAGGFERRRLLNLQSIIRL